MRSKDCVRWLYKLTEKYEWESGLSFSADYFFRDRKGKVRLKLERGGKITVTEGYAWNGCSPKLLVFDLLLGTPEGAVHSKTERPKTYFASMIHDALYQFLRDGLPLTRRQADDIFLRLLRESHFSLAPIYWVAVRLFGGLMCRGLRAKRDWKGSGTSELSPQLEEKAA